MNTSFNRIKFSRRGRRTFVVQAPEAVPGHPSGQAGPAGQAGKISVVVPVYNTPVAYLKEMIESVLEQTYQGWELCLVDGASENPAVKDTLTDYAARDERIRVVLLPENKGVAGNTNVGLAQASGDFVVFLDHDDMLVPAALSSVAATMARRPDAAVIYSDYAAMDEQGMVLYPLHCPDFSRYYYLSFPYIVHLVAIRKAVLDEVGFLDDVWFDAGVSHDVDLLLRIFAKTDDKQIIHIPEILYYWRNHPDSAGKKGKGRVHQYTRLAINRYLASKSIQGRVEDGPLFNTFRIRLTAARDRLVSVIIGSSDNRNLHRCLSALAGTDYPELETIIVQYDSASDYGAVCNNAARQAKGDILLFLRDDVVLASGEAVSSLVELCHLPDAGVVGAKLLYPDNRVYHAGVVLGLFGCAEHGHRLVNAYEDGGAGIPCRGYLSGLVSIRECSAVSGGCLAVKREAFSAVNGFGDDVEPGYFDIDLCLKVREKGYRVLFTPYCLAYYHGNGDRLPMSAPLFCQKWRSVIDKGDPYYGGNLDPGRARGATRRRREEEAGPGQ